jgi:hypothetical protein
MGSEELVAFLYRMDGLQLVTGWMHRNWFPCCTVTEWMDRN